MSLLKKLLVAGEGCELAPPPGEKWCMTAGAGLRVPYAYVLRPGALRVKFGLPCMVGTAVWRSGVAPVRLWGAVLEESR